MAMSKKSIAGPSLHVTTPVQLIDSPYLHRHVLFPQACFNGKHLEIIPKKENANKFAQNNESMA